MSPHELVQAYNILASILKSATPGYACCSSPPHPDFSSVPHKSSQAYCSPFYAQSEIHQQYNCLARATNPTDQDCFVRYPMQNCSFACYGCAFQTIPYSFWTVVWVLRLSSCRLVSRSNSLSAGCAARSRAFSSLMGVWMRLQALFSRWWKCPDCSLLGQPSNWSWTESLNRSSSAQFLLECPWFRGPSDRCRICYDLG